jgi:heme-degrading monooxygenase HmoA
MYKSIWEFTRTSQSTRFPPGNPEFDNLRSTSPGFLGKDITVSADNLTRIVVSKWATEQDALNFMETNSVLANAINETLITYCENNNITATRTIEVE